MNENTRRKMGAPHPFRSKERDDHDLVLFMDMHKRDKDKLVSLLQPVSDDFEPNGHYPFYGMASAKKGPGFGFHGESEKNDYDWLKTPPATPLFPSLEMETRKAQELVVQRELPIIQPLSRFAGKPEETETKLKGIRSKTPNPKPRIPARSVTPNGRSSSLFTDHKKNLKNAPTQLTNFINQTPSMSKPTIEKVNHLTFLASNSSSKTNLKNRGVSPLVRPTIRDQIQGFSDETPANLKKDRSTSASKRRPVGPSQSQSQTTLTMAARRQSCSPSVTRGRKMAPFVEENTNNLKGSGRMCQTAIGGQILGSKMVDKFMNARKSNIEVNETKVKVNGSINEGSGFGRMMTKTSLDMAVKHMEVKRDSVQSRQVGISAGRKSTSTSYALSSKSNNGYYQAQ